MPLLLSCSRDTSQVERQLRWKVWPQGVLIKLVVGLESKQIGHLVSDGDEIVGERLEREERRGY